MTELLTVAEVATHCRVSTRQVRRWIADGRLRAVRFGRRPLVTSKELEAFIAAAVKSGRVA